MNLIGIKFGRLTVLEKIKIKYIVKWRCVCECGNEKIVYQSHLQSGATKSCGCLRIETSIENGLSGVKHGNAKTNRQTKEYRAWRGMKTRCYNENYHNFEYYGGRGIKVCDRWLDSFENFLVDVGKAPSNEHSIDRIDGEGDYEPSNVRWSTQLEQIYNRPNIKKYWI